MQFKTMVSQIGKPRTVSEALEGRDTKQIAEQFGVSRRTAQKWKAGTQQPSKKLGGSKGVIGRLATPANRRKNAANVIRNAQGAFAGKIAVVDKSPKGKSKTPKPGTRNLGAIRFGDTRSTERLNRAADAIERGDYAAAEREFGEAVLGTPGKDYGSALVVDDWPPGFSII
jgi:TolA-binding protein